MGRQVHGSRTQRGRARQKGLGDQESSDQEENEVEALPTRGQLRRTDSTITYDPVTLNVDSTPVGHRLGVKSAGFGWGAAIKAGNEKASMVKGLQDKHATNKLYQSNKEKESKSKRGSGGKRPIMTTY